LATDRGVLAIQAIARVAASASPFSAVQKREDDAVSSSLRSTVKPSRNAGTTSSLQ
jgi:hypothetical protein